MVDWRGIQRKNFTRVEALCDFLELDAAQRARLTAAPRFSLNLPMRLAAKIAKNTLDDPLLRQFVPLEEEERRSPGFQSDPLQEIGVRKERKLLHKYRGRALLLCTSACAMHCRYCFRQEFEYETEQKSFEKELAAIASDPSLKEIILSGGDPLSLSNDTLQRLFNDLASINHIKLIRIHTRFPIGIPERIDPAFLSMLAAAPFQVWMVIHCNHPRELDEDVLRALRSIQKQGVSLLNQAVLLRGVNDTLNTQKALYERLINHGIMPYYLHLLDKVQGAAHFEVSEETGTALIAELRATLPGYAVPRLAIEIPGQPNKTILA